MALRRYFPVWLFSNRGFVRLRAQSALAGHQGHDVREFPLYSRRHPGPLLFRDAADGLSRRACPNHVARQPTSPSDSMALYLANLALSISAAELVFHSK